MTNCQNRDLYVQVCWTCGKIYQQTYNEYWDNDRLNIREAISVRSVSRNDYRKDWDIRDLEITLLEEISGLDVEQIVKKPRRELLLKCHERYVRKLKNLTSKVFLDKFLFPVVRDMVEVTEE